MRHRFPSTVVALLCSVGLGCGGGDEEPAGRATAGAETQIPVTAEPEKRIPEPTTEPPEAAPLPCPSGEDNCASASGTILYVERVDPDGDGDAHFVLLSPDGVTAPGITIVDVRRGLRPSRLPGPGDALSAQGPVFTGSYGQRQIQADAIRVGR